MALDSLSDIPAHLLSRPAQAALGSILTRVRQLHHAKGTELFFVFLPGCEACAASKPALLRFARKHPEIKVRPKSLATLKLSDKELERVATPTYVLKTPGGRFFKTEGALERVMDLEAWIVSNMGGR